MLQVDIIDSADKAQHLSVLDKLLADTFAVDPSALGDDLKMSDVDNWNSLSHIELIVGLEDAYGVQFTQDDVVEMTSVGAIRTVLRKLGVEIV